VKSKSNVQEAKSHFYIQCPTPVKKCVRFEDDEMVKQVSRITVLSMMSASAKSKQLCKMLETRKLPTHTHHSFQANGSPDGGHAISVFLEFKLVIGVLDRVIPHIIDSNICYCVIACLEVDCVSIDTSLFRISHCLL
jgi:hypothetical protein